MSRPADGETVEVVERVVDGWVPEVDEAPLTIHELKDGVQELLRDLGVERAVWSDAHFSVRTLRYYRQRDILSAPEGATSKARYGRRHLLEAATARLAGHVGALTLSDARRRIEGMADGELGHYLAALAERASPAVAASEPRPLPGPSAVEASSGYAAGGREVCDTVTLTIDGGARLTLDAAHPALRAAGSPEALLEGLRDHLQGLTA